MWAFFTTPLAFVGLASLPALAAIYFLRNQPRKQVVSSLLLWIDPRKTPEGGVRIERFRSQILFWLELMALLLLTLAATGPLLQKNTSAQPLIVVLDDSFSMQAGATDSPRKQAAEALLKELNRSNRKSIRLVLAGERPQVLGESLQHWEEIEPLLEGWTCRSASAALDSAVAFALDLGGEHSSVLVLTDHPPNPPPEQGRIRWWSFGTPRPNWAFVNASRVSGTRGDRLLLEIANLASEPRSTVLRIETGEPPGELKRSEVRLNANETHRIILEVPGAKSAPRIRAILDDDDLPFDNTVTLLSTAHKTVRYELHLGHEKLRSIVDRALKASGLALPAESRAELVFQDGDLEKGPAIHEDTWTVHCHVETDADAYTGPFVLDRAHPLIQGLSCTGSTWAGGKTRLPGVPIVMAGNVQLLTVNENLSGRHELHLRVRPDISTFLESPAWPALILNLVQWRGSFLPGLDRANVRLGQEANWALPHSTEVVELTRPNGETASIPVHGRRVAIRGDQQGVYRLRAGSESVEFAANALSRDESDLSGCATGRWGNERELGATGYEYRNLTWMPVLIVFVILTLHLFVRARIRSG